MGLAVPASYRSSRSLMSSLASVKRDGILFGSRLLELVVGQQIGIHRANFASRALFQLYNSRSGALSDPVDFDNGVDVLENGNALLVRRGDDDLQAKLLVETHHLTLVFPVHF